MNEFRFICARLILDERVLTKLLSVRNAILKWEYCHVGKSQTTSGPSVEAHMKRVLIKKDIEKPHVA